jgi:hypothetical protein
VVVGKTDDQGRREMARLGLEGFIQFLDPRPYLQSLQVIAQADAGLIVEAPCTDAIFLPSKVIDYASLGKPVLAVTPNGSVVHQLLHHHGGGVTAPCGNPGAVFDQLQRLYASWVSQRKEAMQSDFDVHPLARQFSPQRIVNCYAELFDSLGVGRQHGSEQPSAIQ